MRRAGHGPDFIEALARGLDVVKAFRSARPSMTLSEVVAEVGLARPTAPRVLHTLQQLGDVRSETGAFSLTPSSPRSCAGRSPRTSSCPSM
jgi:IclR family pca regulon transcriptional regulator